MNRPEENASRLLLGLDLTLSAAESCTGGLIAKRMTDLPGASRVFKGGVVSYTNEVMLEEYGAVSEPVACAMAEGCRKICGSDLAVAVTGVAGPDRDDRGNPVGTVYVALASEEETLCVLCSCGSEQSRDEIRTAAADCAFRLIAAQLK